MTRPMERDHLVELLEGDQEVLERLFELAILDPQAREFPPTEVEKALVARTLVRELEVNWAGVEIILRLREEMLATRQQVTELLVWMKQKGS